MDEMAFQKRIAQLFERHEKFVSRRNERVEEGNGIFDRWKHPVITAHHTPVYWRYDLDYHTNPHLMERLGVNAAFNAGAIEFNGKICLVVRVEGADRKSFFAVAESDNGVDNFRFWQYPVELPQVPEKPDTNVYDMRLTRHKDGWIYGVFCTERKDPKAPSHDKSSAVAQGGIVRTRNLVDWERLPDLRTPSPQQRNVVLHPEFVDGKYAFYTRPMDEFLETGSGGGIGWGLAENIENAVIDKELIIDFKEYHTISEAKNGLGPAPIKTERGWLHLAHGVRNTAAGLRYVLYAFLTSLEDPARMVKKPGGLLLGPRGPERVGDVSNVVFSNGWVAQPDGDLFLYYASSDQRMHVATTTVEKLLDYVLNTPEDGLRSHACVKQRSDLIRKNVAIMEKLNLS